MYQLYIVSENSISTNYGIGTYIKQLIEAMRNMSFQIHVISLRNNRHPHPLIEEKENIIYISIPSPRYATQNNNYKKGQQRYYRNIFYLLKPYFDLYANEIQLFHFNSFHAGAMAELLKKHYSCRIIMTVHYMNWCFDLHGDINKLKEVLSDPANEQESRIYESVEEEISFISECCDQVVAISQHSYNTLHDIYRIAKTKITLIRNGLKDAYKEISTAERNELRRKYHFGSKEKLILFAGRLDHGKGLSLLIETSKVLMEEDSSIRLVVAGDGNLKRYILDSFPLCSRIVFTGYIEQRYLYELYYIADIGVIPSLHEQFGYVALEMMMMGLPVIVSEATALQELVINEETGTTVFLGYESEYDLEVITRLQHSITNLLEDSERMTRYRQNSRLRFLKNYNITLFQQQIVNLYLSLVRRNF